MTPEQSCRPSILAIDDQPDELRQAMRGGLSDRAVVTVVHPAEIEQQDLAGADLVLVDYKLDEWPERDRPSTPTSFRSANGLALSALLREQADAEHKGKYTAIALHTGHLAEAGGRIAAPHARHVLARLNNLDWVFAKQDANRFDEMVLLARAARQLHDKWPAKSSESKSRTCELLGLDRSTEWSDRCWQDVRECQPPIYEVARDAHGGIFLRWLLHQILPYPSFLWSEHSAAACLRLPVDEFRRVASSDSQLEQELKTCEYSGIVAGFLGKRWWRSALEDYVWRLTRRSNGAERTLGESLNEQAGEALRMTEVCHPIVCVDHELRPRDVFLAPEEAVRLRPDHWPAFADAAWMDIATASAKPSLRAIVDPVDDYRLGEHDEI